MQSQWEMGSAWSLKLVMTEHQRLAQQLGNHLEHPRLISQGPAFKSWLHFGFQVLAMYTLGWLTFVDPWHSQGKPAWTCKPLAQPQVLGK